MALLTFNVFSINLNYINYKTVYTFVDFDNYVLTSYFDDREVMKQESSPPSLVKKTRLIVTSVYSLLSIY